jgi:hypothetical protein
VLYKHVINDWLMTWHVTKDFMMHITCGCDRGHLALHQLSAIVPVPPAAQLPVRRVMCEACHV